MTKIEKLVKLVQENPDVEVMAMVETDVVGCDYARYGGFIGESRLDEYYCEGERIYFAEDYDELEEEVQERIWLDCQEKNKPISDDELEKLTEREMDRLKWKKVIVVNIDTM